MGSRESVGLSKFRAPVFPNASSRRPEDWAEVRLIGQADCRASGVERGRDVGMPDASSLTGTGERKRPDAANRRPFPLAARAGARPRRRSDGRDVSQIP